MLWHSHVGSMKKRYALLASPNCSPVLSPFTLKVAGVHGSFVTPDHAEML